MLSEERVKETSIIWAPTMNQASCVCVMCLTPCSPMDCSPPAPLSTEFFRQEYWSGLPFPTPGTLPNPGIKLEFHTSPAFAGMFFTTSTTWEAPWI